MHPVKAYFDQQYGNAIYKSYETYLPRLRCLKEDDFSQIYVTDETYAETPIFACKFAEKQGHENLLALANEDGKIAVQNVSKTDDCNGLHAHNNAIFDLTWLFGQLKIVTASGDHSSKLYDVSNGGITEERTFFCHDRSVKCIASSKDDPSVFATGGRDGNIILWDIRADNQNTAIIGKSDKIIRKSHSMKPLTPSRSRKINNQTSQNNSVTGLAFQDVNTLISCGAGDGSIKVWDLRKTHYNDKREPFPKYTLPYPGKSTKNGFSNLLIDSDCLKLYANCLDGNIYCYNIGTYNSSPIMNYTGHQNNTFYIKSALSYDGTCLISGSSDENAYIWNLKQSKPICKLVGHTAEVTCVAWSQTPETCIVTCSDDIRHKIWRIGSEETPDNFDVEGRGRTEVLPLFDRMIKVDLKRSPREIEICRGGKKLTISCQRCFNPTKNLKLCENCLGSKRKLDDNTSFGPRKLFVKELQKPLKRKRDDILSPLKDLPNFVLDGVAPHLHFSPPKKKHCDWLTRIRIDYNFKRKMTENPDETPTKLSRLEATPKAKATAQKSPLLRYFKFISSNTLKCDKLKLCTNCEDVCDNDK